jgi:hypothetical protein
MALVQLRDRDIEMHSSGIVKSERHGCGMVVPGQHAKRGRLGSTQFHQQTAHQYRKHWLCHKFTRHVSRWFSAIAVPAAPAAGLQQWGRAGAEPAAARNSHEERTLYPRGVVGGRGAAPDYLCRMSYSARYFLGYDGNTIRFAGRNTSFQKEKPVPYFGRSAPPIKAAVSGSYDLVFTRPHSRLCRTTPANCFSTLLTSRVQSDQSICETVEDVFLSIDKNFAGHQLLA